MGRPGKPVELLAIEGKKHLTKAEKEHRAAAEKELAPKNKNFKPSEEVKSNPAAYAVFKKLKKLYKGVSYVGESDEMVINRYCLLSAEVERLEAINERMEEKLEDVEEPKDYVQLYKAIVSMSSNIRQSREMLFKFEDRLLLNPTARIKNVPKRPDTKPKENKFDKFGGARSG